jgi:hypothetical protein
VIIRRSKRLEMGWEGGKGMKKEQKKAENRSKKKKDVTSGD